MKKDNTPGAEGKSEKNRETPEHTEEAHEEAEKDIGKDKSMDIHSDKEDFLDEGELARKEGHP